MSKIGQSGTLALNGLAISVEVVGEKTLMGREMVQVQPIAGSGSKWVNLSSLTLNMEPVKP